MLKYAILSGNAQEANAFAKSKNYQRNEWMFVSGIEKLYGHIGLVVQKVGSYKSRPDIIPILERVRACEVLNHFIVESH